MPRPPPLPLPLRTTPPVTGRTGDVILTDDDVTEAADEVKAGERGVWEAGEAGVMWVPRIGLAAGDNVIQSVLHYTGVTLRNTR